MSRRHQHFSVALALALVPFAIGCQKAMLPGSESGPETITTDFLEAVRVGDDQKVARFLTATARQRTQAMELVVAPTGSETAKYRVCDARVGTNDAEIRTQWSDLDTDGLMHTDEIVWLLRREAEGWRIWGMQSKVFDDQAPVRLDFENPQEMIERQQRAEEELARRERARGLSSAEESTESTSR